MIRVALAILALAVSAVGCGNSESPAQADADQPAAHKEAENHEEGGDAKISPEAARAAEIVVERAEAATLRETLALYGSIQANAERVRSVTARFPGVVRSLQKKMGDEVRSGEVLGTIESNESLQSYQLTAPIAGVVTARNVNPGETAAETPVFVITDLSTVWAELSVFPRDAQKVRIGQVVRVRGVDSSLESDGRVAHVSAVGSSASQSLTARVALENKPRRWTPGLYVTGEVVLGESSVPVAVRNAALQTLDGRTVVFVRTEHGFEARPIETGRADAEWTEVVRGLQAEESYVSKGSFVVKAELGKAGAEHEH